MQDWLRSGPYGRRAALCFDRHHPAGDPDRLPGDYPGPAPAVRVRWFCPTGGGGLALVARPLVSFATPPSPAPRSSPRLSATRRAIPRRPPFAEAAEAPAIRAGHLGKKFPLGKASINVCNSQTDGGVVSNGSLLRSLLRLLSVSAILPDINLPITEITEDIVSI